MQIKRPQNEENFYNELVLLFLTLNYVKYVFFKEHCEFISLCLNGHDLKLFENLRLRGIRNLLMHHFLNRKYIQVCALKCFIKFESICLNAISLLCNQMIKANTFKQCKYTLQGHGSGLSWKTLKNIWNVFRGYGKGHC